MQNKGLSYNVGKYKKMKKKAEVEKNIHKNQEKRETGGVLMLHCCSYRMVGMEKGAKKKKEWGFVCVRVYVCIVCIPCFLQFCFLSN